MVFMLTVINYYDDDRRGTRTIMRTILQCR